MDSTPPLRSIEMGGSGSAVDECGGSGVLMGGFWDAQSIRRRIHRLYAIALSHGDVLYYQHECNLVEQLYRDAKRQQHKERLREKRQQEINALGRDKQQLYNNGNASGSHNGRPSSKGSRNGGGPRRGSAFSTEADGRGSVAGLSQAPANAPLLSSGAVPEATSVRQLLMVDDQHWDGYSDFEQMVPSARARVPYMRRQLLPWKRFDAFIEGCGFYEDAAGAGGITPLFCKRAWIQQVMEAREADPVEPPLPSPVFLLDKTVSMNGDGSDITAGDDLLSPLPSATDAFSAASLSAAPAASRGLTFITEPALMGRGGASVASGAPLGGGSTQPLASPYKRRQSERIALPVARPRSQSRHTLSLTQLGSDDAYTADLALSNATRRVSMATSPLRGAGGGSPRALAVREATNIAPPLQSVAVQSDPFFPGTKPVDVFIRTDRNDVSDVERLTTPRRQTVHSLLTSAMEASAAADSESIKAGSAASSHRTSSPSTSASHATAGLGSSASHSHSTGALLVAMDTSPLGRYRFSAQSQGTDCSAVTAVSGGAPPHLRGGHGATGLPPVGLAVPPLAVVHDGDAEDGFAFAAVSRYRFTRLIVAIVEQFMPPPPNPRGPPRSRRGSSASGGTRGQRRRSLDAAGAGAGGAPPPHLTAAYAPKAPARYPNSPSQQAVADGDYDARFIAAWRFVYATFFKPLEDASMSLDTVSDVMGMANAGLAPLQQRATQRVLYHLLATHLECLLIPLFDRYCAFGTNYVTKPAFLRFCRDLELDNIDTMNASAIFDKTNQYDTEGLLENTRLANLEFDEFVDALLYIGCSQFDNIDVHTTLVTMQSKVWELFRVLRRRYGEPVINKLTGCCPPSPPRTSAAAAGGPTSSRPSLGLATFNFPLQRGTAAARGSVAAAKPLMLSGPSSSGGGESSPPASPSRAGGLFPPHNGGGAVAAAPFGVDALGFFRFSDGNATYVRERRAPRVSIALPAAEGHRPGDDAGDPPAPHRHDDDSGGTPKGAISPFSFPTPHASPTSPRVFLPAGGGAEGSSGGDGGFLAQSATAIFDMNKLSSGGGEGGWGRGGTSINKGDGVNDGAVASMGQLLTFVPPSRPKPFGASALHTGDADEASGDCFGVFTPPTADLSERRRELLMDAFTAFVVDPTLEMSVAEVQLRWDLCGRRDVSRLPPALAAGLLLPDTLFHSTHGRAALAGAHTPCIADGQGVAPKAAGSPAPNSMVGSSSVPRLPTQLTLVCPRHLCLEDMSHFLIGGIFLPNLAALPGASGPRIDVRRGGGGGHLLPSSPLKGDGVQKVGGAKEGRKVLFSTDGGALPLSPVSAGAFSASATPRAGALSAAGSARVSIQLPPLSPRDGGTVALQAPPLGSATPRSNSLSGRAGTVVGPRSNGILAKASHVGSSIAKLAPNPALIDMVQRRETPGSGGGLLPCAGYEVPPPQQGGSPSSFSPTRSTGGGASSPLAKGDVTETSLSNLCPIAVLLGPDRIVARATQVARNRWKVAIPMGSIHPRAYLPVIEVWERSAGDEMNLMSSCFVPMEASASFGFGPSRDKEKAFTIRTRPTQCWQVQLAAKDDSAVVSPSTVDHHIHLGLRDAVDRLTQHQSQWLRGIFFEYADSDSRLLTLSQFRTHVLPAFVTFPTVTAVAPTLSRCEPMLYTSLSTALDAPRNALEELFVRFCTTEQLSQVRLRATTAGALAISHIPIDSAVGVAEPTQYTHVAASFAPVDVPVVSKRRWRVPKSAPAAHGEGALVSGLRRSVVMGEGGVYYGTDTYEDREGVSITGFICFLLYAMLGSRAIGGMGQAFPYADALGRMMPTSAKEHTVWLNANGVDATMATPRSSRQPHQQLEVLQAQERARQAPLVPDTFQPPLPSPRKAKGSTESARRGPQSPLTLRQAAAKRVAIPSAPPSPRSPQQRKVKVASPPRTASPVASREPPEDLKGAFPGSYIPSASEVSAFNISTARRAARRHEVVDTLTPVLGGGDAETPRRMSATTPFHSPKPPPVSMLSPSVLLSLSGSSGSPRSRGTFAGLPPPNTPLGQASYGHPGAGSVGVEGPRYAIPCDSPSVHRVEARDMLYPLSDSSVQPFAAAVGMGVGVGGFSMMGGPPQQPSEGLVIGGSMARRGSTLQRLQEEYTARVMASPSLSPRTGRGPGGGL